MEYRLLALDMDGTLLNSEGEISRGTLEAISEVRKQGVLVTVSTGRPLQGVDKYNHLLQLDGPMILYNGAMIVHGKSREILFEQKLRGEDARKILELGRIFHTTMCVWSCNQLYVNVINEKVEAYKRLSDVEPELIVDDEQLIAQGITKILWIDEEVKIHEYQESFQKAELQEVAYCTSKPIFLEIFSSQVSKAVALEKLGEFTGISSSEMIVVGDGMNDVSAMEYAGLGVAMGNAPEAVKEKADMVTLSNDQDGIAHVIHECILNK